MQVRYVNMWIWANYFFLQFKIDTMDEHTRRIQLTLKKKGKKQLSQLQNKMSVQNGITTN
jgi:hypothetical protein